MGIHPMECMGFLGPNGAGKSTTISIISGLYEPTSGTALVNGLDIRTDISKIHTDLGVCPQENILWDDMTGAEHLAFYGRLKYLEGAELWQAVQAGLTAVALEREVTKLSKEYSGGMKRRLSVAMSMIGNPSLILLDEPSTGLDPASRIQLWDVIREQKKRSSILLTTHAMEEADALCDRVGIFVAGELRTLGTAAELKSRFGKGIKVTVTSHPSTVAEVTRFILQLGGPSAVVLNELAGTQNFELVKTEFQLSALLGALEANRDSLKITDWGISNTTLEEVFLHVVEKTSSLKRTSSVTVR
jgi:ABC-type multidrug transport system ATPase subunit